MLTGASPEHVRRPFGSSNNSEKKPVLGAGGNGRLPEKAPAARRLLKGIAADSDGASHKENVADDLTMDQSWMHVDPAKMDGGSFAGKLKAEEKKSRRKDPFAIFAVAR